MLQQYRWSSLPDDIIAKIISHLDIPRPRGSTIRVSATSFKVFFSDPVTYNFTKFWKILDNLFTLFTTSSINTFSISLDRKVYAEPCVRPILNSWAHRLRARNTQHIKIESTFLTFGDQVCLPSFFQIQSLVSLHLSCAEFASHPIILPNLKKLTLDSVNYGLLRRVLISCRSLEELSFSLNDKPTGRNASVSISSKNLKQLRINLNNWRVSGHGWDINIVEVIIDAPKLDNLYISAHYPRLSMRMIESISNLKTLEITGSVSMTMIYNSPTETIFPYVTQLTLRVSSSKIFEQHMLPYYFPNLEVLMLNFYCLYYNDEDINGKFVLVEYVKHLDLQLGKIRLDQRTLNFLTRLLRSAPILEKLVISGLGIRSSDNSLDKDLFYEILVKCAEDTSRCQIEFNCW